MIKVFTKINSLMLICLLLSQTHLVCLVNKISGVLPPRKDCRSFERQLVSSTADSLSKTSDISTIINVNRKCSKVLR